MSTKTSHDQLFKEVLGEFFPEFIELFFPQLAADLDRDSIEFLPVELFTDLIAGDAFETDLIVKARFRGQESCFIIHVEHQGKFDQGFDWRMFNYFALLLRDYGLPVYPIVIFSHRSPKLAGDRSYTVEFPGWEVLRFNYRVIRLNHLPWRDFVGKANPVASAFMAKMKVRKTDRIAVKLECLRELAGLALNPAQLHLLSGFVDTYLRLDLVEEERFMEQVGRIEGKQKEGIMQIVTSWQEQGRQEGRQEAAKLLIRQLTRKLGGVSKALVGDVGSLSVEQMSDLGEALFDFESESDLRLWLGRVN
jgi:Domain of unknown function (DUF4351)